MGVLCRGALDHPAETDNLILFLYSIWIFVCSARSGYCSDIQQCARAARLRQP